MVATPRPATDGGANAAEGLIAAAAATTTTKAPTSADLNDHGAGVNQPRRDRFCQLQAP